MKNYVLLIGILALFLFLFRIWEPTIIFTDELLIADSALAMANGGSWIVPTVGGIPDFTKPPLTYWLLAIAYKIFPQTLITGRILMAAFGIGLLSITYMLSHKIAGETAAIWSVVLLVGSIPMLYFTKTVNIDLPNAFFTVLTIYLYIRSKSSKRFVIWAGVSLGICFLTRSFLGLIPILVIGYDMFRSKNYSELFQKYILIFVIAGCIIFPWHLRAYMVRPNTFIQQYILLPFNFHLAHPIPGDNQSSWLYYLNIFIYFPPILFAIWQKNHKYGFLWFGIIGYLIVLTISQTRHEWYLIPIYPLLAILAGTAIAKYWLFQTGLKKTIFSWILGSFLLTPIVLVLFTPMPEADIIRAIRTIEHSHFSNSRLYQYRYSLIPQTNQFPGKKVITVRPEDLERLNQNSKGIVIIVHRRDIPEVELTIDFETIYTNETFRVIKPLRHRS